MKLIIYYIIASVLLVSCAQQEEKITWELTNQPEMLVVESIITNINKQQAVRLTVSNPYLDQGQPKTVSGANVTVNDGTNTFLFAESHENPGLYFSQQLFSAQSHKTYQLDIKLSYVINGLMEYTAQSTAPQGLEIDSMLCEIYKMPEIAGEDENSGEVKDTTILGVCYFGKEPNTSVNYYFTKVFRNGKLLETNPKEYTYYSVTSQNATYTHQIGFANNVTGTDTILFRLYTVDRDYNNYLEALHNIDFSGNSYSMSGPPANAVGNVSDGKALGYFLAAYISEKKSLAIDKR